LSRRTSCGLRHGPTGGGPDAGGPDAGGPDAGRAAGRWRERTRERRRIMGGPPGMRRAKDLSIDAAAAWHHWNHFFGGGTTRGFHGKPLAGKILRRAAPPEPRDCRIPRPDAGSEVDSLGGATVAVVAAQLQGIQGLASGRGALSPTSTVNCRCGPMRQSPEKFERLVDLLRSGLPPALPPFSVRGAGRPAGYPVSCYFARRPLASHLQSMSISFGWFIWRSG
jgi:hypothetical protein